MCRVSEPDYALRLEKVENDQDNCDDCDPEGFGSQGDPHCQTLVASVRPDATHETDQRRKA
jgi:hypothetical protein